MHKRTETKYVVVHCADTPPEMDVDAKEIKRWHVEERKFSDIGYHYIIKRDGTLEPGRSVELQGAHALAVNASSVGCCLVGRGDNFTKDQYLSLHNIIQTLMDMYPGVEVIGHSDVEPKKPYCPGFNVKQWMKKEFSGFNVKQWMREKFCG